MFNLTDVLATKIIKIASNMRLSVHRKMKAAGYTITPEQFMIFNILWHTDGLSQTEICELTGKGKSNITRLLDNLVRKKLIYRDPDPNDRRSYRIYLTDSAMKLKDELSPLVAETINQAFKGFTQEERDTLDSYIFRLTENLSELKFDDE